MGTRFNPPQIYHAVQRQRLFRLFDENAYRQNILVVGQAAQGKSTLVASYLKTGNHPVLWFQLSAADDNHSKLYEKLAQGLSSLKKMPASVKETVVPKSTLGAREEGLRHFEALSVLLTSIETRITLVMDDLQTVDENSSGFLLIQQLLDLNIDTLTIILLSRSLPGFDLARLKMGQQIFVIDNESLAFSLEETQDYFKAVSVTPPIDVKKIYAITQGWAGGLALVAEAIRQFKDMSHLPDRLSAEVFSFFSQEIYNRLPEPIRDFLLKASVLETIDLAAVNHLTETDDGLSILLDLEKRNLFIQRIHSGAAQPAFKFHDLFRNFLLKDLSAMYGEDAVAALHRKAGVFFWDNKDHEQAVSHFINAGSFPDIIRIIRIKGTDYLIKDRLSEPERWISHLPDKMIHKDPWLLFYKTMTQRIKGGKKNITQLSQALSLFEQDGDDRGILLCTGFLIEAAVFIRLPSNRIISWIEKGEEKLGQIRSSQKYPWARALLWQQIGLGYIAGDGNIPKGISACRNAILLARQIDNTQLILNASITMTFGHVQAGDFAKARQLLSGIEHMTPTDRHPEYRALKGLVDIELALKNGQFDKAERLLDDSEKEIETFGLIFLYPGFVEQKAYFLIYTAQYDAARQMADHLNDFSILEGNDFYSGVSARIKAMADLYQQEYASALTRVQKSVIHLSQTKKGDIHHFLARQLQGVLLYLSKSRQKAEKSLLPALNYFLDISSELSMCETALTLGLVLCEQKNEKKGMGYLEQGLEKVCRNRYGFFPLLTDRMLGRAILTVVAQGSQKELDSHLLFLISRLNRKMVFSRMKTILERVKNKEKARIKENFRGIYKQLLPKIRISSLGGFAVIRDDRPADPILFEGSRPVLLLKSIVLHGGQDIPKEILIDNLWPDADAGSGEKNFKINLHRLRKTIEPHPEKQFGYSYISQKSGLISLDPHLVEIDADAFMKMSKEGQKKEQENSPEKALEYYERAALMYKGDYFFEEPYADWIHRERDLFRARYTQMMQKKAVLHEELDQLQRAIETWRALLHVDPSFETAYQNLMILYADAGQNRMALAVFEECKRILKKELSAQPDRQTRQIYNRIRQQ